MDAVRRICLAMALGVSLPMGCHDEPTVEVKMTVGHRSTTASGIDRADLEAQLSALATSLSAWVKVRPKPAQTLSPEGVVHPPRTPRDLARLVEALRHGSQEDLVGVAGRIAASSPGLWPQIRALLLLERNAPQGSYRNVLAVIGGDVPNRYGHFPLQWKKAHGHPVIRSEDWYHDLLSVNPGRISGLLRPVYRDCVLQSALLQAAARLGQQPALVDDVVDALLTTAYAHHGIFRDEVGRAIRAVGDEAIAALIRAGRFPEDHAERDRYDPTVRRAAYAREQLDQMDRLQPSEAVAAVRGNPRRLTAVLRAFGHARPGEAAEVLLDHANASTPRVRAAARESFLAYVTGPPPKAVKRTVRLLGGQTTEARAFLSHRQRAELAIRDRLTAEAPDLMEEDCRADDGTRDAACMAQPERLTRAYFAWLDLRRQSRENELVARALAGDDPRAARTQLDRLLVTNPDLSESSRVIEYFADAARAAMQARPDPSHAAILRKGAALLGDRDPDLARSWIAGALLREAKAELPPRVQRRLLAASAELSSETNETTAARDERRELDSEWLRLLTAWGATVAGLFCAGLLTRRVRRRWFGGLRAG